MIHIDPALCCYCGDCVSVCPVDALHLAETRLAAGVVAEALNAGDTSVRALASYLERTEAAFGRGLARNYRLRLRFPPAGGPAATL
jgi:formate hydrogenlyase subunit 6/NADH:ubiquinone oxidoreductase subunit I